MNPTNENHDPTAFDDLHDRLVDRGLSEIVGRETVPNLSARILAASVPTTAATAGVASDSFQPDAVASTQAAPRTRPTRAFWASLIVAAMLLVSATVVLMRPAVQSAWQNATIATSNQDFDSRQLAGLSKELREGHQGLNHFIAAESESTAEFGVVTSNDAAGTVPPSAGSQAYGNIGTLPSPYYATDDLAHVAPGAPNPTTPGPNSTLSSEGKLLQIKQQVEWNATTSAPQNSESNDNIGLQGVLHETDAPASGPDAMQLAPLRKEFQITAESLAFHNHTKGVSLGREFQPQQTSATGNTTFGIRNTAEGNGPGLSGDQYTRIVENPFIKVEGAAAVSTFSIDVDTASYANVRQFLMQMNTLPPPDAVRLEELVNYFDYNYPVPEQKDGRPFASHVEVAACPWAPDHRLVRIGIKGRELDSNKRPKSNLVFLVDVSGSMDDPAKLPLVVYGLQQLTKELGENDRVAIVVYASSEGLVLPSTPGTRQDEILAALGRLQAGGSTAGGAGIQLAYQLAEDNFIEGGTNRVILCTDGDFNVGVTSTAELDRMVEQKAKDTKVFLSVLGFGRGNLNDAMMETIADHGNGNYHYVDNRTEARRVLVEEMTGTLVTIAKDVKIQVEFNPRQVAGYRLLGYENRMLRTEDFNDDKKDAGEIGAGHTITALYEIVPPGKPVAVAPVDDLKYQQPPDKGAGGRGSAEPPATSISGDSLEARPQPPEDGPNVAKELLTLKMRYKEPTADTSRKLEWPITDDGKAFSAATGDFQFAAAVAGFGMLLRNSQHKGNLTYAAAVELAQGGIGDDQGGYRAEFIEMVRRAKKLRGE